MAGFRRALLVAFSSIILTLPTAQAADCGNADLSTVLGNQAFDPVILYGARQAMCMGKKSCDSQDTDRCFKYFRLDDNYEVTITATASGKKYTKCFEALENIIETCYKTGHSDSSWTYNDEKYVIKVSKNPIAGQYVWDDQNNMQQPMSLVQPPDLLTSDAPAPTTTSTPTPTPIPTPPPCPVGKACPDPKPVDQLTCVNDCCGAIPNPAWCNQNCGGIVC